MTTCGFYIIQSAWQWDRWQNRFGFAWLEWLSWRSFGCRSLVGPARKGLAPAQKSVRENCLREGCDFLRVGKIILFFFRPPSRFFRLPSRFVRPPSRFIRLYFVGVFVPPFVLHRDNGWTDRLSMSGALKWNMWMGSSSKRVHCTCLLHFAAAHGHHCHKACVVDLGCFQVFIQADKTHSSATLTFVSCFFCQRYVFPCFFIHVLLRAAVLTLCLKIFFRFQGLLEFLRPFAWPF